MQKGAGSARCLIDVIGFGMGNVCTLLTDKQKRKEIRREGVALMDMLSLTNYKYSVVTGKVGTKRWSHQAVCGCEDC